MSATAYLPGVVAGHGLLQRRQLPLTRSEVHPWGHWRSMVQDTHAGTRNARAAHHQAVGEAEEGPLGDAQVRRKVQNKRGAGDVGGANILALVLEEHLALLTV